MITTKIQSLSLSLSLAKAVLFGNVSWIDYQCMRHYFCLSPPHVCDTCHPSSWRFCNSVQYSLRHTAPVSFQRLYPLLTPEVVYPTQLREGWKGKTVFPVCLAKMPIRYEYLSDMPGRAHDAVCFKMMMGNAVKRIVLFRLRSTFLRNKFFPDILVSKYPQLHEPREQNPSAC